MRIEDNEALVTTATTLASAVSLGVTVIRELAGDAIADTINGVNIHTDATLAETFTQILREELMIQASTRLPT